MDEYELFSLKQAAAEIKNCNNTSDKYTLLTRAFELFSLETERLERAYNSLKDEFAAIHKELETTNKNLIRKVTEMDMMSFYFQSLISKMSQGLLFVDLNGDVTTYNMEAANILDIPTSTILFSNFWAHLEDDQFGFSMREALANRCSPHTIFTTIKKASRSPKILEINTTFVNEEGSSSTAYGKEIPLKKFQGIIILIRDITKMKRLQAAADRNDRLKELGEMAALVAHEIRNPLGGIKGFASLLKRDLKEEPERAKMAQFIIEGTENLNRLVTNVLNYARPVELRMQNVNLPALLKELQTHFEADANFSESISIHLTMKTKALKLSIDPQLIKSALLNLIVNAQQAMVEKGGEISLSLDKDAHHAILTVADQGCGIPPENLNLIFSPFFTTKAEGNGFGLAEVSKIIQAHDGSIKLESELGVGTVFTIKLPLFHEFQDGITLAKEQEG
jgi:signal transduction histidine kinase